VVPALPPSIQSLTLELFSLGYPAGFLGALIDNLPNLKSLVVYSQLFAGISAESQQDAVHFFDKAKELRALHLLDVFARPHFIDQIAPLLRARDRGLVFLEVSYSQDVTRGQRRAHKLTMGRSATASATTMNSSWRACPVQSYRCS
jgi:hypothetical protein